MVGVQDTGHDDQDPGLPTSKRSKRLLLPDSSGAEGEVGTPQHLFPSPWGLVEVCTRDAWNLPAEGIGVGGFDRLAAQPRGLLCSHQIILIRCMHAHI